MADDDGPREEKSPTPPDLFELSLSELIDHIQDFPKAQRLEVLEYLVEDGDIRITEHADGCRVNLDKMTEEQLRQFKFFLTTIEVPEFKFSI
jgi:hypothetical protein